MNTDLKNLLEDKRKNIIYYNDNLCDKAIALLGESNQLIFLVKILEKSQDALKLVLGFNDYNFFMMKSVMFIVKDYKSLNQMLNWILICIENHNLNITCDVIERIRFGKNSEFYDNDYNYSKKVRESESFNFIPKVDRINSNKIGETNYPNSMYKDNIVSKIDSKFNNMTNLQKNGFNIDKAQLNNYNISTLNEQEHKNNEDSINKPNIISQEPLKMEIDHTIKKTKDQIIEESRNKQKFTFFKSKLNSRYLQQNILFNNEKKTKSCPKINSKIAKQKIQNIISNTNYNMPKINVKFSNNDFIKIFHSQKHFIKNPYKYLNYNQNNDFYSIKESDNIENEDDYSGLIKQVSNNNNYAQNHNNVNQNNYSKDNEIVYNCFIDEIMTNEIEMKLPICLKIDQNSLEEYKFVKRPSFCNIALKYKRQDRSMTYYSNNENNESKWKYSKTDEKQGNPFKKYTNNSTNFSTPEANRNQNLNYNYNNQFTYNTSFKSTKINKNLFQYDHIQSNANDSSGNSKNEYLYNNDSNAENIIISNKYHGNDNFHQNSSFYQNNNYRQRSNTSYGNNFSHINFTNNVWRSKNKFFN